MTLDGQVLLIAFLATSLELILWATESDNRFPRQRSTSPEAWGEPTPEVEDVRPVGAARIGLLLSNVREHYCSLQRIFRRWKRAGPGIHLAGILRWLRILHNFSSARPPADLRKAGRWRINSGFAVVGREKNARVCGR